MGDKESARKARLDISTFQIMNATLLFEILLPHIVVVLLEYDINSSAIDVKSWKSPKTCHTHIISLI